MLYPCDNKGFSVPVVFRSKAQCAGNCSSTIAPALFYYLASLQACVAPCTYIHVGKGNGYSLGEHCNAAAGNHRVALRVSLSTPTDCVAPLDKGMAIACEARFAVNVDKLTEPLIITWIEHKHED